LRSAVCDLVSSDRLKLAESFIYRYILLLVDLYIK
jgi:hypothetical protein